ncbi:MAG: cytidylate kinase-like family protein [Chloroflexota bacterium]
MPVITIARQYGSLGDEIGKDIASRLGLRLVDNDIIVDVAQRLGVPVASLSQRDERGGRLVSDLVKTMQRLYPATLVPRGAAETPDVEEASFLQVIRQVLWEVARDNQAVIVGRASTFILAQHPDIVHLLVVAPLEIRIERVMAAENLDQQQAAQRIDQVDNERTRYIRHFYRANWLDVNNYDLVVNTGHFSQLQAVSLLCTAISGGPAQ